MTAASGLLEFETEQRQALVQAHTDGENSGIADETPDETFESARAEAIRDRIMQAHPECRPWREGHVTVRLQGTWRGAGNPMKARPCGRLRVNYPIEKQSKKTLVRLVSRILKKIT